MKRGPVKCCTHRHPGHLSQLYTQQKREMLLTADKGHKHHVDLLRAHFVRDIILPRTTALGSSTPSLKENVHKRGFPVHLVVSDQGNTHRSEAYLDDFADAQRLKGENLSQIRFRKQDNLQTCVPRLARLSDEKSRILINSFEKGKL